MVNGRLSPLCVLVTQLLGCELTLANVGFLTWLWLPYLVTKKEARDSIRQC